MKVNYQAVTFMLVVGFLLMQGNNIYSNAIKTAYSAGIESHKSDLHEQGRQRALAQHQGCVAQKTKDMDRSLLGYLGTKSIRFINRNSKC